MQIAKVKSVPIVYRELAAEEELLTYFKMRYKEWLASGYQVMVNRDEFDIDIFDCYSHFMGAFIKKDETEILVGGVRMVKESLGPTASIIKQICQSSKDLKKSWKLLRPCLFPLMENVDISWFLKECSEEGKKLVEFGRTVIDPKYRSKGIGLGVVNAIFKFAAFSGIEMGVGECPEKLHNFYGYCGCETVGNLFHPGHGFNVTLLKIDLTRYANKQKKESLVGIS